MDLFIFLVMQVHVDKQKTAYPLAMCLNITDPLICVNVVVKMSCSEFSCLFRYMSYNGDLILASFLFRGGTLQSSSHFLSYNFIVYLICIINSFLVFSIVCFY